MAGLIQLTWEQFNNLPTAAGAGTAYLLRRIGDAAKSLTCNIYRLSPQSWVPSPGSSFTRGFYNELCQDDPGGLPAAPQSPFSGGQCPGVNYIVNYTLQARNISNCNFFVNYTVDTPPLPGAIGVPYFEPSGGTSTSNCRTQGEPVVQGTWWLPYDSGAQQELILSGAWDANNDGYFSSVVINSVTRQDGQPDNCGNPPSSYPPPGDFTQYRSTDIDFYDESNNLALTVPLVFVDASPEINIAPYFDIGGIQVKFDIGGITFKFDDLLDIDINSEIPCPECVLPPDVPSDCGEVELPPIQDTADHRFLRVTCDISNYTGDTIFTDSNGDDIVFAGYIRWLVDGEPIGEELAIRRLTQLFFYPKWANGYRLVAQNNIILSAVELTRTIDLNQTYFVV